MSSRSRSPSPIKSPSKNQLKREELLKQVKNENRTLTRELRHLSSRIGKLEKVIVDQAVQVSRKSEIVQNLQKAIEKLQS